MCADLWLGLQQDWDRWHALRATVAAEIEKLKPPDGASRLCFSGPGEAVKRPTFGLPLNSGAINASSRFFYRLQLASKALGGQEIFARFPWNRFRIPC